MSKVLYILLLSFSSSQYLGNKSIEKTNLYNIVESASRSQQTVFIDMFTGLN